MKENGIIFLIENSTDYLFSLDQAFRRANIKNPIRVARYGNEAILYLKGIGIYQDRNLYPLPEVILIDLALPDGSALSVVGWLRRQQNFRTIPLVALVHSTQQKDIHQVFSRDMNAYFVDVNDLDGVVQLLHDLQAMYTFPIEDPGASTVI